MSPTSTSLVTWFQRVLDLKRVLILALLLSAILVIVLLPARTSRADASPPRPETPADILAAYNAAIYDSAVYKFSNLRPLKPLTFDPATKSVTVVALTPYPYKLGSTSLPGNVYLWVTQVPEVQQICRGFSGDLELRLRQLLGLHPASKFDNFVVMTVTEGQIFRPTANPDPKTPLPCSDPTPVNCGETFPNGVSDAHFHWIANKMLSSYVISESSQIPDGYPWTRLGYTYDWKPGANKYGASEYVIMPGSKLNVTDIIPYKTYCNPNQ